MDVSLILMQVHFPMDAAVLPGDFGGSITAFWLKAEFLLLLCR